MCRHLAYLGPPVALRSVVIDPSHGLYRQSWAPRLQRHATVNADGFGIGWYAGSDPVPARYRRELPIWGDPALPDIARVTRSGAVLAAVRSATAGMALGAAAAAPFASGSWLFSHNGTLNGWPESAVRLLSALEAGGHGGEAAAGGPVPHPSAIQMLLSLEAMVDSALLWALVLRRLRAGTPMAAALAATIAAVEASGGTGRFNFLLTDGRSIAATACGDTLWYRRSDAGGADAVAAGGSVTVASEPGDDDPGWTEVPDRHVLTATPSLVQVQPLGAAGTAARQPHSAAGTPLAGNPAADIPAADIPAAATGPRSP